MRKPKADGKWHRVMAGTKFKSNKEMWIEHTGHDIHTLEPNIIALILDAYIHWGTGEGGQFVSLRWDDENKWFTVCFVRNRRKARSK